MNLKYVWKCIGPKIVKVVLKKKKPGRLTVANFNIYYEITVIKAILYCLGDKQIDQMKESPEIDPSIHGYLLYDNVNRVGKREKNV